jgi:von Willebrand factor type A domain
MHKPSVFNIMSSLLLNETTEINNGNIVATFIPHTAPLPFDVFGDVLALEPQVETQSEPKLEEPELETKANETDVPLASVPETEPETETEPVTVTEPETTPEPEPETVTEANEADVPLVPAYHYVKLEIASTSEVLCKDPIHLLISVDCSGSMDDKCGDGRTKQQHINHTTCRILQLLSDTSADVVVTLHTFDSDVHTIFDATRVTPENLNELELLVKRIRPNTSTNIGAALMDATKVWELNAASEESRRFAHIQLTDGDAYPKVSDATLLDLINPAFRNVFIGYGNRHNAVLLDAMGKKSRSENWYVDNLELSGEVYGAVIHSILYPSLENVAIEVEGGEVYDWRTNEWTNRLETAGPVYGGQTKTYHVRSQTPLQLTGKIFGVDATTATGRVEDMAQEFITEIDVLPQLTEEATGEFVLQDHTKDIYRLRTQQLLWHASQLHDYSNRLTAQDYNKTRVNIEAFYTDIKTYMENNNLANDVFMKVLEDDLVIANKTMGTNLGTMYCTNRQTSQGKQLPYNVTNLPETEVKRAQVRFMSTPSYYCYTPQSRGRSFAGFGRANACTGSWPGEASDDDDDNSAPNGRAGTLAMGNMMRGHTMSDNTDSPYQTQTQANLMRSLSS